MLALIQRCATACKSIFECLFQWLEAVGWATSWAPGLQICGLKPIRILSLSVIINAMGKAHLSSTECRCVVNMVLLTDIIQIVTGVEVTIGNCFTDVGKYCPTPKAEGNISHTEGKQFPIVTDNNSICFVIPHSNTNKNTFCGTRYLCARQFTRYCSTLTLSLHDVVGHLITLFAIFNSYTFFIGTDTVHGSMPAKFEVRIFRHFGAICI